ncbi:MAG: hypothetical protein JSU61_06290 [Fidelibacterota bacterium]|nr:MAG: hypothetical protein JSU61_06290 [Candidatus Neomarinimicrobiota bacterium]
MCTTRRGFAAPLPAGLKVIKIEGREEVSVGVVIILGWRVGEACYGKCGGAGIFLECWKDISLKDISPTHCTQIKQFLLSWLKPGAVNVRLRAIRTSLNWLVNTGKLD